MLKRHTGTTARANHLCTYMRFIVIVFFAGRIVFECAKTPLRGPSRPSFRREVTGHRRPTRALACLLGRHVVPTTAAVHGIHARTVSSVFDHRYAGRSFKWTPPSPPTAISKCAQKRVKDFCHRTSPPKTITVYPERDKARVPSSGKPSVCTNTTANEFVARNMSNACGNGLLQGGVGATGRGHSNEGGLIFVGGGAHAEPKPPV